MVFNLFLVRNLIVKINVNSLDSNFFIKKNNGAKRIFLHFIVVCSLNCAIHLQ